MKKHRWLFVLLGVVVLGVVLTFGVAFGAGLTYFFLHADPVQAAFGAPVQFSEQVDNTEGVLIAGVGEGSAAAAAGLVRGDILLEVDGQPVNNLMELQSILAKATPGDSVELTVQHGDETRTLTAELGERGDLAYLGVNTCGGPMGNAMMFGDPQNGGIMQTITVVAGAKITEVIAGTPAEEAGLQIGDLILSVDGEEISRKASLADLIQAHKPGDKVILAIQSEDADAPSDVEVTLGENPDNADQAYLGIGYQMGVPRINGQDGPHFFFQNGEEFNGQLPKDLEEGDGYFFHGMPFGGRGMPNLDRIPELPEGVEGAVVISEVIQDTPAAQADLQPGDLVLAIDGEPVTTIEAFTEALQSHKPGDEVSLTVFRAGDQFEVSVALGEHPDDPAKGFLGVLAGTFVKIDDMQLPEGFDQEFEPELPGIPGGDA